jgi:predicted outer membrane protein
MKTTAFTLSLCLALAAGAEAAPKKRKPGTSTLPPTSKMIVLPTLPPVPKVGERPVGEIITTEIGGRDLLFLTNALQSSLVMATLSDLAKNQAESSTIKDVGQTLSKSQREENEQLVRLASLKGVALSTETPEQVSKMTDELAVLTKSNFDKGYMDKIVAATQDSVAAYKIGVESKDSDIKGFATTMQSIVEIKLGFVQQLTGAGTKAAKALFRTGPAGGAPTPAVTAPASTPPPSATPAPTSKPAATPAPPKK